MGIIAERLRLRSQLGITAMSTVFFDSSILDRMVLAVELVRNRLKRAAAALESAKIPYAVVGGNAVAAWVAKADPAAVRNTQDVDLIIARSDLESAKVAMEAAGFTYRHVKSIDMFLDGPGAKARDAVHILFAGEKVRGDDFAAAADLGESETIESPWSGAFRVASLEALVRMKLTSYRLKDQVHLLDLIDVGLVDASWPSKFVPELGQRLQTLIDNPDS
jgi:hypothetical protein